MSDDLLERLNEPQREAVTHTDGPLLILAGAGSGKTRVLTHRIAWLVRSGRARPWEILAVTFTNKAAEEMKARVAALVPEGGAGMWVSTFHSACLRILRRHVDRLGYSNDFVVYDDGDQQALVKRVCKELKLPATVNLRAVSARIDQAKNRLVGPEELDRQLGGRDGVPYGAVYKAYQEALARHDALDFNDLIGLAIRLFEEHGDLLERYRATFRHLLVDEYQDTNHAQYRLVTLLGRREDPADEQVTVVGDDDQSIYSFRGADIQNILDFGRDFPRARVVRLEQNYRSTSAILQAATSVVSRNRDRAGKTLWTAKPSGSPIEIRSAQDDRDEARRVVEAVREMQAKGYRPAEIAVFYRTNGQSRVLEDAFQGARIPFQLVGGQRFYERKEVKDVLAWLRLVVNPADDVSFERAVAEPPRGIGDGTVGRLRELATDLGKPMLLAIPVIADRGDVRTAAGRRLVEFAELVGTLRGLAASLPLRDLLREVYARTGYADRLREEDTFEAQTRLDNLEALLNQAASEFGGVAPPEGLRLFLDRTALVADTDSLAAEDGTDQPARRDRVTLMTVHNAKGLEYPVVLLAGMDERLFPHVRSLNDPRAIEEERRLCYVAFTRAMERLVVFHARRRFAGGESVESSPSRFLRDVPLHLLTHEGRSSPEVRGPARRPAPDGEWIDYDDAPPRTASHPGPYGPARGWSLYGEGAHVRPTRPGGAGRPAPGASVLHQAPAVDAVEPRVVPDAEAGLGVGARVRHPKFGVGEVRRVEGPPHNLKVTIHFRDAGPKEILVRYAALEPVDP